MLTTGDFTVERRRSQRVVFQLEAESILKNANYKGTIENFSREGMMKVIPNGRLLNILPGTKLHVTFETPSGTKLHLQCEVRWVLHFSNMPFGLRHHVGLKIQNPTRKYMEFVHNLSSMHCVTARAVHQN